MATWTLYLTETPLNTVPGQTGVITPLTLASGISLGFKVDDIDTLSFTVPGRHWQTGLIRESLTDVIAWRDEEVLQRFRVTSLQLQGASGNVTAQVTCSAYREVVNSWMFHDEGDALDYPTPMDPADAAWTILNEGQVKQDGALAVTPGVVPVTPLDPQIYEPLIDVNAPEATPAHYFAPGQSRAEGINAIAQLDEAGFEWAIEPDPADPWTKLKLNVWNRGGRFTATTGLSDFLLSEASMASWSVTRQMSDYANVLRVTPNTGTVENTVGGLDVAVWRPADENPANTSMDPRARKRGRWEMDVPSTQYNPDLVGLYADEQLVEKQDRGQRVVSCTLVPGRWEGPDDFWIGDSLRLVLQIPLVDDDGVATGDYLIDVDTTARAVGVSITVGTNGSEEVSLELDRTSPSLMDIIHTLRSDVATLKRR